MCAETMRNIHRQRVAIKQSEPEEIGNVQNLSTITTLRQAKLCGLHALSTSVKST